MSWLGKIFGQRSAAEWLARAESEWNERDYGRAKLSFESAHDASDATTEQKALASAKITECRDRLAEARIKEAEALITQRDEVSMELARNEIRNAMEIAASEQVIAHARALAERMDRKEAREHAEELAGDEADVLAALAGTWEPEQIEEYEEHGEALTDAMIKLHRGEAADALAAMNQLLESTKDPHYLLFEVGRAQLGCNQIDAGAATLRRFLASIGPDEGGESRLVAHMELAAIAKERGDFDGAVAELENAIEALPDDPRPYLSLGTFLRKEGHATEAIEVLNAAQDVLGESKPQWRISQELGLAYVATGATARGIELLEQVVQTFAAQRLTDLPAETAAPLAALHEAAGNRARAADLYATLARGSDREHLYDHSFAAGRLLLALDQRDDGLRLLRQALEHARTPAERDAAQALIAS